MLPSPYQALALGALAPAVSPPREKLSLECTHLERTKLTWIPVLPLIGVEAAIASSRVPTHNLDGAKITPGWKTPLQECAHLGGDGASPLVWHQPLLLHSGFNQGMHTVWVWGNEGGWNNHRTLGSSHSPNQRETNITPRETQTPQGSYSRLLGTNPILNRSEMASEYRTSPSQHLILALAIPIPVLPLTKSMTASTPWGKIQLMLTSYLALPPKPLGTCKLHRDIPIQGHILKAKTGNCFT